MLNTEIPLRDLAERVVNRVFKLITQREVQSNRKARPSSRAAILRASPKLESMRAFFGAYDDRMPYEFRRVQEPLTPKGVGFASSSALHTANHRKPGLFAAKADPLRRLGLDVDFPPRFDLAFPSSRAPYTERKIMKSVGLHQRIRGAK